MCVKYFWFFHLRGERKEIESGLTIDQRHQFETSPKSNNSHSSNIRNTYYSKNPSSCKKAMITVASPAKPALSFNVAASAGVNDSITRCERFSEGGLGLGPVFPRWFGSGASPVGKIGATGFLKAVRLFFLVILCCRYGHRLRQTDGLHP